MPLDINIAASDHVVVVRCRGRIVVGDDANIFRETTHSVLSRDSVLVLDLRAVRQIDACGAGILAELCATAMRKGCVLGLFEASDRVQRVLRLTRLDCVMPDFSDTLGLRYRGQIEPACV